MQAPLLRLSNVTKAFAGVQALKGVSFDVLPGEVHAVVGENGAGKSTLARLMTGAQTPDSGTIEIAGHSVGRLNPARARRLGIACVYQQPALFPDLTVAENISLRLESPRPLRRVKWAARRQGARLLLERVGAAVSPDAPVRDLSLPHQQLVEIACAVGAEARVVIMDEPTASLTQHEQSLLFSVIRELRRRGAGVVYVSHRLEEVFALADRVTVLRDGDLVRTCAASELTSASLIRLMVGREVSTVTPDPASPARQPILALRTLGCSCFGVRDVGLELHSGEIFGLAGLVGAGRSELARTLFGITPADQGEIHLSGRAVILNSPEAAIAHGIAYLPEDRTRHGLILEFTIAQNISLASHRRIFPRRWLRRCAERRLASEYISALDIRTPGPDTLASSLSGGNQQKVALARWLATKPVVLILDEPTQGVDIGAKSEIHKLVRGLAREGLAVLLISSELPELIGLSDRIGVMRGGTLVAQFRGGADPQTIMAAALGQSAAER